MHKIAHLSKCYTPRIFPRFQNKDLQWRCQKIARISFSVAKYHGQPEPLKASFYQPTKSYPFPPLQSSLTLPRYYEDKDAAHVLLDSRIKHSDLEGAPFSHMLSFLACFFQSNPSDLSFILESQFTQCAKWAKKLKEGKLDSVVEEIVDQAQILSFNESILIPGGWTGDPLGHAMLYTLTKMENGNYTFRVINTGAGIDYHIQIQGYKKIKSLLACSYINIPKEKLFYGTKGIDFFKFLLSFQANCQKPDFKAKIIYEGALALLTPYRNDADLMEQSWLFITPQRSGTCTLKASKAYVRLTYFLTKKSKEEYKAFSEILKEQTLRAYFNYAQNNPSEKSLLLLYAMQRKVAHTFNKRHPEIPQNCSNLLREVDSFLKNHNQSKTPNTDTQPASLYQPIKSPLIQHSSSLPQLRALNLQTEDSNSLKSLGAFLPLPPNLILITGDNAQEHAKSIVNMYSRQMNVNVDTQQAQFYISHHIDIFANKLSLNREDWKNTVSFSEIYKLLNIYCTHSVKSDLLIKEVAKGVDAVPQHFITVLTLYHALWAMFPHTTDTLLDTAAFENSDEAKKLLKTLVPPKNLFEQVDKNPFFFLLNPKEQKRFLEVRNAFDLWEQPENGCSVFQDFFSNKVLPNPCDPEIFFSKKLCNLFSEDFIKGTLTPYLEQEYLRSRFLETSKEIQNQTLLIEDDSHPFSEVFSPFRALRESHCLIGMLAYNFSFTCTYSSNMGNNQIQVKKYSYKTAPFSFQGIYGYRADLPLFFKEIFKKLESLGKNQDLTTFTKAIREEANSLKTDLDIEKIALDTQAFYKLSASFTTNRSIAPFQLLTLYSQHASLLQDPHHRTLFLTQLFKTSQLGKNAVQEAIVKFPDEMADEIALFIKSLEALAFNIDGEPDHKLFLFSSYVLFSIAQYYSPEKLPQKLKRALQNQRTRMKDHIASLKVKNEENQELKRSYHIHYLYALTVHGENTAVDLSEVFSHYFAFSSFSAPKDNPYLFIEYDIISRIHTLLPLLTQKNKEFLPLLIESIIEESKLNSIIGAKFVPNHIKMDQRFAKITFQTDKGRAKNDSYLDSEATLIEMHCSTGDIFYNGTLLERSGDFNPGSSFYQLLFGKNTYLVRSIGGIEYLTHPAGTFRKIDNQISFRFKNQEQEPWVIFHPADQMEETIPLPLRKGYCHFYDSVKKQWTFVKGRNYEAFDTSLTWKPDEEKIYFHDQKSYYASVECPALATIERPDCIYKRVYHHHETYIEVPRYNLVFIADKNQLKWQDNTAFHLVENNLPQNTLSVQKQSLLLQDRLGNQILLVPRFQIQALEGFNRNGFLNIPKDEKGERFDWSTPLDQEHYSSYNVSKSETGDIILTPFTPEDTLTLAYYRLHDRNFHEFASLLKTISPFDPLSDISLSILEWIIFYGELEKNHSPEVAACILHAGLLFYRTNGNNNPSFTFSKEFSEKLIKRLTYIAKYYLSTKSHINKTLHLTQDEEETYSPLLSNVFASHLLRLNKQLDPVEIILPPPFPFNEVKEYNDYSFSRRQFDDPKQCQPKLPTLNEPVNHNDFLPLYQAIFLEIYPLNFIETLLLSKLASQPEETNLIKIALICIAAKKQGKSLPKFPNSGLAIDFSNFNKDLEAITCKSVSSSNRYQLPKAAENNDLPDDILETFRKPRKTSDAPSFHLGDVSSLSDQSKVLWKVADLHREEYDLPEMPSYALPSLEEEQFSLYYPLIEAERKRINRDIKEGEKRLAERQRLTMIGRSYGNLGSLITRIEKELVATQKAMNESKNQILDIVNNHLNFSISGQLTKEQCRAIEETNPPLTINDLEHISIWGEKDPKALKRAYKTSPQLKEKTVQQNVWKYLCTYEQHAVTIIAYQKVLDACKKAQQAKGFEQNQYYAELAEALETDLSVLSKDSSLSFLQMLIFARISKCIPREDQVADIIELSKGPCVLQKIMGGGKTSVIAALWAFREARYENKLPVLFAESSLYNSLGDNLKKGQQSVFNQEIFTIDGLSSELDLPCLKQLEQDLKKGFDKKQVLVMRAEVLQSLDLELQRLTTKNNPKDQEKEKCLRNILTFFKTHASALGDEIDLLLRADFEVNFPDGYKTVVLPSRVDLTRKIFTYLSLNDQLGLKEETQGLRSKEELQIIFEDLAKQLLDEDSLCLKGAPKDVKRDFCMFLTEKEGREIPEALKNYVEELRKSPKGKEASALISLAHHIVVDILPYLFKQSPGLHFGRTNDRSCPGKVVPFTGANTPSNREIGYPYEALCKQLYTASIKGIDLLQLEALAIDFTKEAKREALLRKCPFLDTRAAKDFNRLTKQNLDQAKEKEVLETALRIVNDDIEICLEIEVKTTAFKQIGHHQAYRNSSAQALPNLVSSLRGMTGTPWNYDGYHQKLGKLKRDNGAEGKILYTLLERADKTKVHVLSQPSIETLLDEATKDGGKFPDAILDMGALFKKDSIETTARQFLEYAKKNGINEKNAVLFFHHKPNELTRNHLAVGRFIKGDWKVEFLKNTRKEALIDKGLTIDGCLTFFDQNHCTGTDISLPFQAHGIITASKNIELRTFLQTIMRERQFCSSQTADFALLKEVHDSFKKGKNSVVVQDLLTTALKNQAEKKALFTFRSFRQQIDEVFIDLYRKHSRSGCVPKHISKAYDSLICSQVVDDPYNQFFRKKILQDPIEALKIYRNQRLALLKNNFDQAELKSENPGSGSFNLGSLLTSLVNLIQPKQSLLNDDFNQAKKETDRILKIAQEKKETMPKQILSQERPQGKEAEIQIEQEQEKETEQEVSQEIQEEFESYQKNECSDHEATYQEWWNPATDPQQSVKTFIQAIRDQDRSHPADLLSAPQILKNVRYNPQRHFDQIFPENILMTAAMQRSYEEPLPIFHKTQKLAHSILIVKNNHEYIFVIVSAHEADFLLKSMSKDKPDSVWLVNANGHSYLDNDSTTTLLKSSEICCKGLVYTNAFLGRGTSIEDIPKGPYYLDMWLKGTLGTEKDREDYLTLRSCNLPLIDQFTRVIKDFNLSAENLDK